MRANRDPRLLVEEVTKRGEVFGGEDWEGGITSPSSSSSSSSSTPPFEDSGSEGVSYPHALVAAW
jgi:hypothetical protein